ncbi:hypothetical protein HanRHA438_Chr13g0615451 [Helianthus annuus]|nr:hypothetical protein HanRHA438_Chr13g0615451 [Helianthus annuus]
MHDINGVDTDHASRAAIWSKFSKHHGSLGLLFNLLKPPTVAPWVLEVSMKLHG